jgi:ribosomal protein S12 methylthiotransferase
VDAEAMLYSLSVNGFIIGVEEAEADAIIINTCGFIEDAKNEAIENILDAAKLKGDGNLKALIVTGCLAERYRDDITREIPEVDAVVGIGSNKDITQIVKKAIEGNKANYYGEKDGLDLNAKRILGGYPFSAYIKISDGCDNCCTYCAIPEIRGRMRSREIEDIVDEAKTLAENGVKELVVVAQDTTAYGKDIYGEPKIAELLEKLCEIEGIHWIRTLYTYPEHLSDKLIKTVKENEKLVKYFDIPLQHVNGDILKRMNRKGNKETISALIKKLRSEIEDVTIRTTFITGFPGETDEQFTELHEFIKETRFDRLGCFAYSPEEDTPAAAFDNQIDEQTKQDRAELIMGDQMEISASKNEEKIGKTVEVLVEGYDSYIKCYFGRTAADAPEVDGKIFFFATRQLNFGEFVKVVVNDSIEYDLLGEMIDESAE